jgi:hypothetical protein
MYYLAEFYVPAIGVDHGAIARSAAASAAALELAGVGIQFLRAVFVPGDEIGFALYRAATPDAVADAGTRAGLQFDRIREAIPTLYDTRCAEMQRSER